MTDYKTEHGFFLNDKNRMLSYEFLRPSAPGPHPCLVMGHGYGGHKRRPYMQKVKAVCASLNIAAFSFDLTGCGLSEGKLGNLTPKNAKNDWKAAARFAASLAETDTDRLFGFGTSFSANALTQFAAEDDAGLIKELILHVPVPKWRKRVEFALQAQMMLKRKDVRKIDEETAVPIILGEDLAIHVSGPLIEQLREMNLYKDAAPHIHRPVTIIGGEMDELVSPKKLWKLRESFPGDAPVRVEIVRKAGHGFDARQLDVLGVIVGEALQEAVGRRTALRDKAQNPSAPVPLLRAI